MQTTLSDRRVLLPILITAIAIAVGSALIVVLSDDASGGASTGPATVSQTASGDAVTIEIADFVYKPESLTVNAGTKTSWVNRDAAPHTATAGDAFDTGNLRKGERRTLTLEKAGTYAYICEIHAFMKAIVIVK